MKRWLYSTILGALALTLSTLAIVALTPQQDVVLMAAGGSAIPTGTAGSPNAAVVTVQGIPGMTPVAVTDSTAGTSPFAVFNNGASTYEAVGGTGNSLLTNSAVSANSSLAGTLLGYTFHNPNTVTAYVQFFDVIPASVTLGTTAPKFVVEIPAGGYWETVGIGRSFSNSITLAATTTLTGSTALTTGVTVDSLDYR